MSDEFVKGDKSSETDQRQTTIPPSPLPRAHQPQDKQLVTTNGQTDENNARPIRSSGKIVTAVSNLWSPKNWRRWISVSILALVVSVCALVATCIQTRISQQQTHILQQQTRISDEQRKISLNAERAHVLLKDFAVHGIDEIVNSSQDDGPIYLTYVLENYGRTPAWVEDVTFRIEIKDKGTERSALPSIDNEPKTSSGARFPLLPGKPLTSGKFKVLGGLGNRMGYRLTKEQAKAIRDPCTPQDDLPSCSKYLFVYGRITYRDVFYEGNQHASCFYYLFHFVHDSDEPVLWRTHFDSWCYS